MKINVKGAAGLILLALVSCVAQAQQDAGSLLREQELQQQRQLPPPVPPAEPEPIEEAPLPAEESGPLVRVTALHFSGETNLLSPQDRESLTDEVAGRQIGIRGLQALAARVTARLQQRGHILAFALLPPQDVTGGTVTLEIRQGKLEAVVIEPGETVRMRTELLQAIGEKHLMDGITRARLEEGLLRLNELPGITARGRLAAGESDNSSRLYVSVDEAPLFGAALHANNYGAASTGKFQTLASLSLRDATGYADYSSLALSLTEGQRYAALSSSVPLGASGFGAHARVSRLDYEHRDNPGKLLELEGHADMVVLGLDYGWIRSRRFNLSVYGDYQWKNLVDDSVVGKLQDKTVNAVRVGARADYRDDMLGGGVTGADLQLTFGDLDLSGAPQALAADQASLQTDGRFRRVNLMLTRYQSLPGTFSLMARLNGQWASKNLDSSEGMSLGGPFGVRGWPVGEAQGDAGAVATVEASYRVPHIPVEFGQLQLSAFFDAGRILINKHDRGITPTNACECNSYSLQGAGLSANWSHRRWNVTAAWARGLGSNPGRDAISGDNADGEDGRHQLWMQASFQY